MRKWNICKWGGESSETGAWSFRVVLVIVKSLDFKLFKFHWEFYLTLHFKIIFEVLCKVIRRKQDWKRGNWRQEMLVMWVKGVGTEIETKKDTFSKGKIDNISQWIHEGDKRKTRGNFWFFDWAIKWLVAPLMGISQWRIGNAFKKNNQGFHLRWIMFDMFECHPGGDVE